MHTISTRISDDVQKDLERFIDEENIEKSGAFRKLLISGLDQWKIENSLKLLTEGRISFNRASEISGLDCWEFAKEVKKRGIPWVSDEWISEDLE